MGEWLEDRLVMDGVIVIWSCPHGYDVTDLGDLTLCARCWHGYSGFEDLEATILPVFGADEEVVEISEPAKVLIGQLVQPSWVFDADLATADQEVWEEVRAAFPLSTTIEMTQARDESAYADPCPSHACRDYHEKHGSPKPDCQRCGGSGTK